jgi:hypothetical protein
LSRSHSAKGQPVVYLHNADFPAFLSVANPGLPIRARNFKPSEMPPPRPSPLEEPDITADHELNAERFWDESDGTRPGYFYLNSDHLDNVRKRLRPGQRPKAWSILRWLLTPRDVALHLGQEDDGATWTADRCVFEGNSIVGLVSSLYHWFMHSEFR